MTQKERELLRHSALRLLARKCSVSHDVEAITWRLRQWIPDIDFSNDDVEDAIDLLEKLNLVKGTPDSIGATKRYEATAEGVMFYERCELQFNQSNPEKV